MVCGRIIWNRIPNSLFVENQPQSLGSNSWLQRWSALKNQKNKKETSHEESLKKRVSSQCLQMCAENNMRRKSQAFGNTFPHRPLVIFFRCNIVQEVLFSWTLDTTSYGIWDRHESRFYLAFPHAPNSDNQESTHQELFDTLPPLRTSLWRRFLGRPRESDVLCRCSVYAGGAGQQVVQLQLFELLSSSLERPPSWYEAHPLSAWENWRSCTRRDFLTHHPMTVYV